MSAPAEIAPPSPPAEPGRRRTAARLAAVQALYQMEVSGASAANVVMEFIRHRLGHEGEGESFGAADEGLFADLVEGASARRGELDQQIAAVLTPDWPLERLEIILRAILRAGAYELLARPEVPVRVAISEYIDIAHAFFAGKEPGLVNGVLDRLARTLRPAGLREEEGGNDAEPR
jgi:transcription antitermination protein NusB